MSHPPSPAPSGIPFIDRVSERIGHLVAWLTLAMVLVTVLIVVMRYAFDSGRIWLQESVTWMHAFVFLLGAAYASRTQDHVRVDVFYRRFSPRRQALVEVAGTLLFLWPMCGYILYESYDYVAASWRIREASREAGGLKGLFVLKSVILAGTLLLALQGLSDLVRALRSLSARRPPAAPAGGETGAA